METVSSINTERSLLAVLSTCCITEDAFLLFLDEEIHLASTFQLAGYRLVIAALCEGVDELSLAIAEKCCQLLVADSGIVGHDRVAYARNNASLARRRICNEPLARGTVIQLGLDKVRDGDMEGDAKSGKTARSKFWHLQ